MGEITDQIAEFQKSGSEDAFSVLVHQFQDQLRALVVCKIGTGLVGNSTASDFVQETFAQAHWSLIYRHDEYLEMNSLGFRKFLAQIAHHKIGAELERIATDKRDASREERTDDDWEKIQDKPTGQPSNIVASKEDALNYWEEAMREGTVTKGFINILGLALEMKATEIKFLLDKVFPDDSMSLRTIEALLQKMRIRMRKQFPETGK